MRRGRVATDVPCERTAMAAPDRRLVSPQADANGLEALFADPQAQNVGQHLLPPRSGAAGGHLVDNGPGGAATAPAPTPARSTRQPSGGTRPPSGITRRFASGPRSPAHTPTPPASTGSSGWRSLPSWPAGR